MSKTALLCTGSFTQSRAILSLSLSCALVCIHTFWARGSPLYLLSLSISLSRASGSLVKLRAFYRCALHSYICVLYSLSIYIYISFILRKRVCVWVLYRCCYRRDIYTICAYLVLEASGIYIECTNKSWICAMAHCSSLSLSRRILEANKWLCAEDGKWNARGLERYLGVGYHYTLARCSRAASGLATASVSGLSSRAHQCP